MIRKIGKGCKVILNQIDEFHLKNNSLSNKSNQNEFYMLRIVSTFNTINS